MSFNSIEYGVHQISQALYTIQSISSDANKQINPDGVDLECLEISYYREP